MKDDLCGLLVGLLLLALVGIVDTCTDESSEAGHSITPIWNEYISVCVASGDAMDMCLLSLADNVDRDVARTAVTVFALTKVRAQECK